MESINLTTSLKTHFGYDTFRPGQEEIIQSILEGQDTLALMPTGGGKSICFQLPALLLPGITLVISPLIALMKDQVDTLQTKGIAATFLNSTLDQQDLQQRLRDIRQNKYKLVYVAPERLTKENFLETVLAWPVSLIAIDEAHCVSQWGHDFRPDYLLLAKVIQRFGKRPTVAAFTATATPEVKTDIIAKLGLREPTVFVRGFDRPNLLFFVRAGLRETDRYKEVARVLTAVDGPAIVYVGKRDTTEELVTFLKSEQIEAAAYHAGLNKEERTEVQENFMNDKTRIIVATIAFGMGVDKPDVRLVIHAHTPASLENYYQEAGRAGRDGEKAYCVLLHSYKDMALHQYFIQKARDQMLANGFSPEEADRQGTIKRQRLQDMEQFALNRQCRRQKILAYFDDPGHRELHNCQKCDICLDYTWKDTSLLGKGKAMLHRLFRGKAAHQGTDELLFEKLRLRRFSLAQQLNVRAFMIFHDSVLREMAEKKPLSLEDMGKINGVGPRLLELYGDKFLRVIERFQGLRRQPLPGESPRISAEMFQDGKTVSEISQERGLAESTIRGHLFQRYEQGQLPELENWLTPEIEQEIEVVLKSFDQPPETLVSIKERCSERVGYEHLRIFRIKQERVKAVDST